MNKHDGTALSARPAHVVLLKGGPDAAAASFLVEPSVNGVAAWLPAEGSGQDYASFLAPQAAAQ